MECQWPAGSARWRTVALPSGGQQFCPVADSATCRYTADAANVLFIGPPDIGKSMLAVALGHEAVNAGLRV